MRRFPLIAAGVVVDGGGGASHAATIAREYGLPAVMGTLNATAVLTTAILFSSMAPPAGGLASEPLGRRADA